MTRKIISLVIVSGILSACGGTSMMPTKAHLALDTIHTARERSKPREADYKLSCKELDKRIGNLQTRFDELSAIEEKRRKKNAIKNGLIGAGISAIGASVGFDQAMNGSVDGVRATQTATAIADRLAKSEDDAADIKSITDKQPIAFRLIALKRVSTEKCIETQ